MDGNPADRTGPGGADPGAGTPWDVAPSHAPPGLRPDYPAPFIDADVDFVPSDTSAIPIGPLYLQTPYRDRAEESAAASDAAQPQPIQQPEAAQQHLDQPQAWSWFAPAREAHASPEQPPPPPPHSGAYPRDTPGRYPSPLYQRASFQPPVHRPLPPQPPAYYLPVYYGLPVADPGSGFGLTDTGAIPIIPPPVHPGWDHAQGSVPTPLTPAPPPVLPPGEALGEWPPVPATYPTEPSTATAAPGLPAPVGYSVAGLPVDFALPADYAADPATDSTADTTHDWTADTTHDWTADAAHDWTADAAHDSVDSTTADSTAEDSAATAEKVPATPDGSPDVPQTARPAGRRVRRRRRRRRIALATALCLVAVAAAGALALIVFGGGEDTADRAVGDVPATGQPSATRSFAFPVVVLTPRSTAGNGLAEAVGGAATTSAAPLPPISKTTPAAPAATPVPSP